MNKILWLAIGAISVIGGFFALLNPLGATLAVEQIAGWTFLFVGIVQMLTFFREQGKGAKILAILGGIVGVLIGVVLLHNPLKGILALTILVASLFMAGGVAKIFVAMQIRGTRFFWPIVISGAISVMLSLMIFTNFPQSAASILGILLAVELISNGLSLIMFALEKHRV